MPRELEGVIRQQANKLPSGRSRLDRNPGWISIHPGWASGGCNINYEELRLTKPYRDNINSMLS